MNFKSIAAASLLVGTIFSAAAATAVKADLGTLSYAYDDESTSFSTAVAKGSTFADVFSFSLDAANEVTGSAQVNTTSKNYAFTGKTGTLSLYEGVYSASSSLSSYTLVDTTTFTTNSSVLDDYLSAGSYFFVVSGTSAGAKGVSYNFDVTAVPEPANAALLLAGLGLFGVVAKRRKLN